MFRRWFLAVGLFIFTVSVLSLARADEITVTGAYARLTPTGSGGAFMVIHNHASTADRLIAISTEVARKVELHETKMDEGVMRMRPVEAIELPAKGMAALRSGGPHVMLFGVPKEHEAGDSIDLTLHFERAGNMTVSVEILPPGGAPASMSPGHDMPAEPIVVTIHRISPDGIGEAIGTITANPMPHGVHLVPAIDGLEPGPHAFHVHENPDCGAGVKDGAQVAGLAAGGHFDPTGDSHGAGHGHKPAGDLPQLLVDGEGRAAQVVEVKTLELGQLIGRSIMIHAHEEEPADSSKAKGGGARIACGVVAER